MKTGIWKKWIISILAASVLVNVSVAHLTATATELRDADQNTADEGRQENDPEVQELTDSVDLKESEIKDAVTDAVYENEIREHADSDYVGTGTLKLVNAVMVKQSLFDREYLEDSDTIDTVMSALEQGDPDAENKFIAQISNPAALYEIGEDADYLVADVNTMQGDGECEVRDAVFALYDNEGNVLSDCIYDSDTGLAYIPRADCINENGEQILMNVQVQLMQAMDPEHTDSEVTASVCDENGLSDVLTEESGIFDISTTIPVEAEMDEENLTVSVNGIPLGDDSYEYDEATGNLTIDQSSALIDSVSVNVSEDTIPEKLAKVLDWSEEVNAMTVDEMQQIASCIELPSWVRTGTLLTGTAMYSYNARSAWTYSYGFGVNDENKLGDLISLIENGGTLDMSKLESQKEAKFITTYVNLASNTLKYGNQTIPDLQKIPVMHLECAHADTPLGSVSGAEVNGGNFSQQQVRLRFLNVNREQGYAIFGIYTVETHTQTGAGIFKIGLAARNGTGTIAKKAQDTQEVLAGAEYQVYADKNCTIKATDVNGNNAVFTTITKPPFSNMLTMKPGTYYVRETKAPSGYLTDERTLVLTITAGKNTYVRAQGSTDNWLYDAPRVYNVFSLKIVKKDADTADGSAQGSASLEGAVFRIRYEGTGNSTTDQNEFRTWFLRTDENGIAECSEQYRITDVSCTDGTLHSDDALFVDADGNVIMPPGRYEIEEIQAPSEYQLEGTMTVRGTDCSLDLTDPLVLEAEEDGTLNLITDQKYELTDTEVEADVYDCVMRGQISIEKYDADGTTPLAGVEFSLEGMDSGEKIVSVTDENGKITWENLIPQTYQITEVSTKSGDTLMTEPMEVQLPMKLTPEEVKSSGADPDSAEFDVEDQIYCFYQLDYKITNDVTFQMPETGENPIALKLLPAIGVPLLLSGFLVLRRIRKHRNPA